MKYVSFIALHIVCFCVFDLSFAQTKIQPLKSIYWQAVKLPVDSVVPYRFVAYDSMHAFCLVKRDCVFVNSYYYLDENIRYYYFETTDGGKSWYDVHDTSLWSFYGGASIDNTGRPPDIFPVSPTDRHIAAGVDTNAVFEISTSKNVSNSIRPFWSRDTGSYQYVTYLTPDIPVIYDLDSGYLYRTTDKGKTFNAKMGGDIFHSVMQPSTLNSLEYGNILSYVRRDLFRHTFVVRCHPTSDTTSNLYRAYPPGLHTMVTTNMGTSWTHHLNPFPAEYLGRAVQSGELQYSSDTSRLFFLTCIFSINEGISRYTVSGPNTTNGAGPESDFRTNFGYSDDDGKTWTFDSSFRMRRRGFEPSEKTTLWMTLTKEDMTRHWSPYKNAFILARTTDMGATWEFDSTTLGDLFEQEADGHQIEFSDPRHGWIVARIGVQVYILRYDANEQPLTVEANKPPTYFHYMWLYPIPAKDEVQINFLKKGTMEDVEFFDVMGRKVSVTFTMTDNTATASVKDIPSGYYIVRAKLSGSYYARPLIVGK